MKPTKVTSARDHFRRKAPKIVHPSSATSTLSSNQIPIEHQSDDQIDYSIVNLGPPGMCCLDPINFVSNFEIGR